MYSINVLTNFRGNFYNIYSLLTVPSRVPSRAFTHIKNLFSVTWLPIKPCGSLEMRPIFRFMKTI